MRLIKHFERGYGHAQRVHFPLGEIDKWQVRFFDNYDAPCIFSLNTNTLVLDFLTLDTDYD